MPRPSRDLMDRRFGKLVAKFSLGTRFQGKCRYRDKWLCECDCGSISSVWAQSLLSGKTKSCGCYRASANGTSCKGRRTPERMMFINTRSRAKARGIPFDLSFEDIHIPSVCPLLGIPLVRGVGVPGAASPSIDKIIPNLGYIKGNVQVISQKANAMKQNATLDEFEMVARNWRRLIHGQDSF